MTATAPGPTATLADAREWLRSQLETGASCPCCTQRAQVYRRSIHATMARELIALYRASAPAPAEYLYVPDVLPGKGGGDFAKLVYWGLIEELEVERPDGGRAGWWRLTTAGREYAKGQHEVPRHAHVYDGRLLKLDGAGVTIRDALGTKFDLDKLLAGEA